MNRELLHATAIAIDGDGVLLIGPSGSGKSDMALRLIDRGARLVSDDVVAVETADKTPTLSAASNIEGKLEVRGIGICAVEAVKSAMLRLVVELATDIERMPAAGLTHNISGFAVPMLKIAPFEPSAAIKVEYALRAIVDGGLWPVASSVTSDAESTRT